MEHFAKSPRPSWPLLAALLILAVLAIWYFAWPIYRAFLPLQIDVREAWNTYHADAIGSGHPLYGLDDFTSNNYPPLSFYLVSILSAVTHLDVLYVGRALSLAATLATALAVWACVRQLGMSRLAATLAAIWWLATAARWFDLWIGSNDPDLVAIAIMSSALAYALRPATRSGLAAAIIVMAAAGFYKHNFVAIPAATLCWITLQDRRRGLLLALLGISIVAAGLAICGAVFGAAFFHDMLLPRHYDLSRIAVIGRTQFIAPALVIAAVWAAYRGQSDAGRFVILFASIAFVSFLAQSLADGVSDNAMFELAVAAAIGLGCAFDELGMIPLLQRWPLDRRRIAVVGILIARLVLSLRMTPYLLAFSPGFRADLADRAAVMAAESTRIAALAGPIVCDVTLVCRFAGKPLVYDPFIVGEYIATGKISPRDVAERIKALHIRFEKVDPRTSIADLH